MAYKVIIMPPAKRRLDMYVHYTIDTLKNRQAAKAILTDAVATKKKLSVVADSDSIKVCDNPMLKKYGYRIIRFEKHKFLMVYRIQNNQVIVDGMFHELQDYEGIFIREFCLD